MPFYVWFIAAGGLLTLLAFASTTLSRLPLSVAQLYVLVGVALGPLGLGLLVVDPVADAGALEVLTEIAVSLSLFVAGLKLRTPFSDGRWKLPLRLALVSMTLTVGLIAAVGVWGLGLGLGAAVLLGACLAPTDPVLAADVQIESPDDRDRLRFSLTGEAGFNDGTAFPFVMLGLGLLGAHELGPFGLTWLGVDVLWAVFGGLAVGGGLGVAVGRLVVHLRKTHREAVGTDDFLALGLVALSYGLALLVHSYAFLAAFAAGLALRWVERHLTEAEAAETGAAEPSGASPEESPGEAPGEASGEGGLVEDTAAPAYMAESVLGFSEQIERIGALAMVVLVGALVQFAEWSWESAAFLAVLFLVIRPAAVWLGLLGSATSGVQRGLMSWFGVRGIGSLYYLFYALEHGLPEADGERLLGLILAAVAVSVVAHGISVTPVMRWYAQRAGREERVARAAE